MRCSYENDVGEKPGNTFVHIVISESITIAYSIKRLGMDIFHNSYFAENEDKCFFGTKAISSASKWNSELF